MEIGPDANTCTFFCKYSLNLQANIGYLYQQKLGTVQGNIGNQFLKFIEQFTKRHLHHLLVILVDCLRPIYIKREKSLFCELLHQMCH